MQARERERESLNLTQTSSLALFELVMPLLFAIYQQGKNIYKHNKIIFVLL